MTVKLSRRSLLQGVSLAAQQLGVNTATATRQMTTLRTLLHDPLFLRGHDGLVPTARMSELVPKLKVLQEGLIDVVRRPVKFDPAEIKSTIRVAGVDNAIFAFLMPCLKDLYGVATGLHLSCVPLTENFPKHLASGRIDIAFYAPPLRLDSDFREIELFESDHVTVVRNDHPLALLAEKRWREGKTLLPEDFAPYREIKLSYGSLEGNNAPQISLSADDGHVAMDCGYFLASVFFLMETDFYARLPAFTAEYLSSQLPLTLLPKVSENDAVVWKARMIWHERTDRDPALQWFCSMIAGKLRGLNQEEVAQKLTESINLDDPSWDFV